MPLWVDIYIYINIFIIGTLFGSFFTLATYRIPRKQDIVATRSYCPTCKHKLNFFDLIPVWSYIFQGGKCRYCKEKISIRYLLFEVFSGIAFVLFYMLFGFTIYFVIAILLYTAIFLNTGCYIMNKKKINEELKSINNKNGIFVAELVIAALLFSVVITTSYISSKNYINKEKYTIASTNSILECSKNLELALMTKYDSLESFSNSEELSGVLYTTNVTVTKYSDEYIGKKDYIKKITAKTEYMIDGKTKEYEISTIKKREI